MLKDPKEAMDKALNDSGEMKQMGKWHSEYNQGMKTDIESLKKTQTW